MLAFAMGLFAATAQAAAKPEVFVDYHVPRFTRLHDGSNGVWRFAGASKTSRLADTFVSYNQT